jgi:Uma2 family endonuclease
MKTLLKLGPADHGRPLTQEEYTTASYQKGYHYELIRGRLYVSPAPNLPEDLLEGWISDLLRTYMHEHPEVINHVTNKGRVFIPGEDGETTPEPDVSVYHDFPHHFPRSEQRWQDVSPVLVVEVLSEDNPDKDTERNLALYLQVPSIREYWIVDGSEDADHPTVLVHRRRGQRWQNVIRVTPGSTYTTRLLPGFILKIEPLP